MNSLVVQKDDWEVMKSQAKALVDSGFLPKAVDTPQKAITIMMMAKELGIGPMEGLNKISVIQGKPTISPELQKAMVHKKLPNALFEIIKSDETECIIEAARPGNKPREFKYTMTDAKRMNLAHKDNWIKQPKVMLKWRCIGDVCRTVFPDCLSGVSHSPEEINPDIKIDESGQILDIKEEIKAIPSELPSPPLISPEPAEPPIEVLINETEDKDKQKDRRKMYALMKQKGWTKEQVQNVMMKCYGTDKTTLLKADDFKALLAVIEHQTYEEALKDIL